MTTERSRIAIVRGLVRRDLMVVCAVIFIANITNGAIAGSFSLYAKSLGASVAMIGLLTAFTGVAAMTLAVPIGLAADRFGRKRAIVGGMVGFTVAHIVLATAPSPLWLAPGRMLAGGSVIAAIWMSSVILADVARDDERAIAYGFFTTIIGFAYALGPVLVRAIDSVASMRAAFATCAMLALAGASIAWLFIAPIAAGSATRDSASGLRASLRTAGTPQIAAICVANILIAVSFVGVVFTMVPLVIEEKGIATASVAGLLTVRTIASTLVRFPSGAIAARIGTRRVLVASLVLCIVAVGALATADTFPQFLLFTLIEGLGYGMFLASSQTYIAENTERGTRGAAMGLVSMTSGFGVFAAPLALGLIGDRFSLGAVFPVAVAAMAAGLLVMLSIWRRIPASPPNPTAVRPSH